MSLCNSCGNILVHDSCSPLCLVCQHTGRVTATEVKQSIHEAVLEHTGRAMKAHERSLIAALDATYAAIERAEINDEIEAARTVRLAEIALATRMFANIHVRPRPKWSKTN